MGEAQGNTMNTGINRNRNQILYQKHHLFFCYRFSFIEIEERKLDFEGRFRKERDGRRVFTHLLADRLTSLRFFDFVGW